MTFVQRLLHGLIGVAVGLVPGLLAGLLWSWQAGHAENLALVALSVAGGLGVVVAVFPSLAVWAMESSLNFMLGLLNGLGGGTAVTPDREAPRVIRILFWTATALAVAVLLYLPFRAHP